MNAPGDQTTAARVCASFALLEAAVTPSLHALAGTLIVCASLLAACYCLITPARLARHDPGYLMTNRLDEYACLTGRIHQIVAAQQRRDQGGRDVESIIIIGDSTIREAVSSEARLAQEIEAQLGRPVNVYVLAAGGLTQWEQVAITDALSRSMRGCLFVLEISPHAVSYSKGTQREWAKRRLAIESRQYLLERKIAKLPVPRRGRSYFLTNVEFFASRSAAALNLVKGPVRWRQHVLERSKPWTPERWQHNRKKVFAWERPYRANRHENLKMYERMFDFLRRRRSASVVLLDGVQNPFVEDPDFASPRDLVMLSHYRSDVATFARRSHAPLWRLDETAGLTPADFIDYAHIHSVRARRRYTSALAEKLVQLLKERSPRKGAAT